MEQNRQSYRNSGGDRQPETEFRIQTKAMDMLDYTLRITENTDHFPKWMRGNLVKYIRDTATEILQCIVEANAIQPGGETPVSERRLAQEKAIRACTYLLALIDISGKNGRVNARQRQFWGQKVKDVKFMTMAWNKKERAGK